MQINKPARF